MEGSKQVIGRRETLATGAVAVLGGLTGCSSSISGSSTSTPAEVSVSNVRITDRFASEFSELGFEDSNPKQVVADVLVEASTKPYFDNGDVSEQVRAVSESVFGRTDRHSSDARVFGQALHNLNLISEKKLALGDSAYVTTAIVVAKGSTPSSTVAFEGSNGEMRTSLVVPSADEKYKWNMDVSSTRFFGSKELFFFSYESREATKAYMSEVVSGSQNLSTPLQDLSYTMVPADLQGELGLVIPTDAAYEKLSEQYYSPGSFVSVLSEKAAVLRAATADNVVIGFSESEGFYVEDTGRQAVELQAATTLGLE